MRGSTKLLIVATIFLTAQTKLNAQEVIVPAGTILQCTLTEPNLSSKTTELGEPILCSAGPLREFGVAVFPGGAYLGGRFADYRDPGHFWGKGWMQLEFDRVLLHNAEVPLSAKVVSAPRLKVDAEGRIHGRGHARRDTVEWMVPPLWPVKILTLPMRGPRPALKGESRLTLKLMQDVSIPEVAAPPRPTLKPGLFRPGPGRAEPRSLYTPSTVSEQVVDQPIASDLRLLSRPVVRYEPNRDTSSEQLTFLVLKDGRGQLVKDYRFEDGFRLRFLSADGTPGLLPIAVLDFSMTVEMNRQRGVEFVVRSRNVEDKQRAQEGDEYRP